MNTITQMQLTKKLLAMAAVCAVGLPQCQTKAHTRFNNLRTVNSYGEFVWQICRRKGHPVAVISRNGRHYYNLKLMLGFGSPLRLMTATGCPLRRQICHTNSP